MSQATMRQDLAPDQVSVQRQLRDTLGCFASGVTIVTTRGAEGRPIGLTVNSFASLSLDPPLLLWSLAKRSPNRQAFETASHFAINVLTRDQADLARRFANPALPDKFAGLDLQDNAATRPPLLAACHAHFVCERAETLEAGDHVLFIGRVASHQAESAEPLLFYRGAFAALLKD